MTNKIQKPLPSAHWVTKQETMHGMILKNVFFARTHSTLHTINDGSWLKTLINTSTDRLNYWSTVRKRSEISRMLLRYLRWIPLFFSVCIIQKDTSKRYQSLCKHTSKLEQRQNVSLTPSIIFHIYIKLLEEWSSKFFLVHMPADLTGHRKLFKAILFCLS